MCVDKIIIRNPAITIDFECASKTLLFFQLNSIKNKELRIRNN